MFQITFYNIWSLTTAFSQLSSYERSITQISCDPFTNTWYIATAFSIVFHENKTCNPKRATCRNQLTRVNEGGANGVTWMNVRMKSDGYFVIMWVWMLPALGVLSMEEWGANLSLNLVTAMLCQKAHLLSPPFNPNPCLPPTRAG